MSASASSGSKRARAQVGLALRREDERAALERALGAHARRLERRQDVVLFGGRADVETALVARQALANEGHERRCVFRPRIRTGSRGARSRAGAPSLAFEGSIERRRD